MTEIREIWLNLRTFSTLRGLEVEEEPARRAGGRRHWGRGRALDAGRAGGTGAGAGPGPGAGAGGAPPGPAQRLPSAADSSASGTVSPRCVSSPPPVSSRSPASQQPHILPSARSLASPDLAFPFLTLQSADRSPSHPATSPSGWGGVSPWVEGLGHSARPRALPGSVLPPSGRPVTGRACPRGDSCVTPGPAVTLNQRVLAEVTGEHPRRPEWGAGVTGCGPEVDRSVAEARGSPGEPTHSPLHV